MIKKIIYIDIWENDVDKTFTLKIIMSKNIIDKNNIIFNFVKNKKV